MVKTYLLLFIWSTVLWIQVQTRLLNNNINDGTLVELVVKSIKGNGDVLAQLDEHIEDFDGKSALYEFIDLINDNETEEDNGTSPICFACRGAAAALKALAASLEWDEARDAVLDVCYTIFENQTDIRSDILCPGTIDLQGPHIYEVLLPKYRRSPEDICRNLNLCIPDKPNYDQTDLINNSKRKTYGKTSQQKTLSQRKLESMKVIQLADIHIEPDYIEGTATDCGLPVCCVPDYGQGDAGMYGDYRCNIPTRTVELFLEVAASMQPEFLLFSGDTPPHAIWEETYASQLNCTAILTESMNRILADYKVYPSIGNHEMYPTNLYSVQYLFNYTKSMNEEFAYMWESLAGFTEENMQSMMEGGYYSLTAMPGIRIISFNSNYWYTFNWYSILNEGGDEIANMMNFLRSSFERARADNEKIILIGHHPPGNYDSIVIYTWELQQLLAEFSDLVIMQIAGHTHDDQFKVLSTDDVPIAVTWVSPPVTSLGKDPSMRVFYIDSETLEVFDYEKYGFSLREVMESGQVPNITLQYSAMEEYGLNDMSPQSWRDLINRLETDDELFRKYYYNYVARGIDEECDDGCRRSLICNCKSYSYDDYNNCIEEDSTVELF